MISTQLSTQQAFLNLIASGSNQAVAWDRDIGCFDIVLPTAPTPSFHPEWRGHGSVVLGTISGMITTYVVAPVDGPAYSPEYYIDWHIDESDPLGGYWQVEDK